MLQVASINKDDILTAVNGVNVKCKALKEIKAIIVKGGDKVELTVVTPMPATSKPTLEINKQHSTDTVKSSASNGASDMQQMGDTMTGSLKKKMKNLTFLKGKKSSTLKESLRKQ